MNLLVAIATNDSKNFITEHFGDADYYDIYTLNNKTIEFIKQISNTTEEEEDIHADPKKAKGITGLLKKENVQVVVSKIFGPNLKRIKSKFVCIISQAENINICKDDLINNIDIITKEWEKGESRNFLRI